MRENVIVGLRLFLVGGKVIMICERVLVKWRVLGGIG